MAVTRRDFLRLGRGAAASAALVALGSALPRAAYAVAVVDDAVIGAAVATVAALGGYLVTSGSAPSTLDALGTGFRSYVQSESIKAQAVQLCLQAAAEHEAEILEADAQAAADAVASVSGFFYGALEGAAETGRLALDGVVSGVSAGAGVLRGLVSLYMSQLAGKGATLLSGTIAETAIVTNNFSFDSLTNGNKGTVTVADIDSILAGIDTAEGATWALRQNVRVYSTDAYVVDTILYGNIPITLRADDGGRTLVVSRSGNTGSFYRYTVAADGTLTYQGGNSSLAIGRWPSANAAYYTFSASMVAGTAVLPGVDRATDAPDVIAPGYNSLPLGQDFVIDGETGAVAGAGTVPLPQSVPDVIGGLNDWLEGALAGVVPGTIALPVPVSTPVVVATPAGITTMPIERARTSDTSLVEPGYYIPPSSGIDPPVTVPEGPWTPAVTLPFEEVWPFNMIFDVVEMFGDLGA